MHRQSSRRQSFSDQKQAQAGQRFQPISDMPTSSLGHVSYQPNNEQKTKQFTKIPPTLTAVSKQ